MSLPDISIIMPMYNVELYIEKCLLSIINQTFYNWELFIIDDGSEDATVEKCQELIKNDGRIILIKGENKGVSAARNAGLEKISGKYVLFIDSDDYIENDMLESLYKAAEISNADIICCNFYYEYLNKSVRGKHSEKKDNYTADDFIISLHTFGDVTSYLWNKLIRFEYIGNIRFNEKISWCEDYVFLMDIYKSNLKLIYIDKRFYHYVQRKNSVCNYGYSEELYFNIKKLRIYINKITELYPNYKYLFSSYLIIQEMVSLNWMLKNYNYNNEVMKEIKRNVKTNFINILKSKKTKPKFVIALLVCCFSTKLYLLMYKIITKNRLYF